MRQLVCALHKHPEQVEESCLKASDWLAASLESLRLLKPVVLWSENSEEELRQAELDLKECQRLLKDSSRPGPERGARLAETLLSYYSHLFKLQRLEAERPAFSPVLSLDQLINVAFNLLQQKVEVFELRTRFPLAHADVLQMRAQLQARRALFEEVEFAVDEPLLMMEGGLGAVAHYLETGERKALEEAIQLLGRGSGDFAHKLGEAEAVMRTKQRHSPYDAVEFWTRLIELPSDLGEEVMKQAWERLFQEVDAYQRVVEVGRRAGLAIAQPELVREANLLAEHVREQLAGLGAAAPAEVAAKLNPLWEALGQYRGGVQAALSELQIRFEGAPRMLELVEILGQVDAGVLPVWVLRDEIEQRQAEAAASLQALQESPQAPENLVPLLGSHDQAYQRLLLYCEDPQLEHLVEGWKLLALTMPPLLAFEKQVRRSLAQTGKSGQQVTCIRCGHVQIPGKVCTECGSALPQLQIDDVQYEDIAGGPARGDHQVADHLTDLVQGLTFGVATWEQILSEIVNQLQALEKTRERFERELVKIMGKDENLDTYCQFFVICMGKLSQALTVLGEAAQTRQLTPLKAGLTSYRQLHEELIEFQKKITEGIGKIGQ
ncbi:MAG: hypothetical protein KF760_24305 [Candidatus Eremiobacteraeota bacterium]|nr:hypothetical protein [Candidatus Eremiobacteraeota bacterium]